MASSSKDGGHRRWRALSSGKEAAQKDEDIDGEKVMQEEIDEIAVAEVVNQVPTDDSDFEIPSPTMEAKVASFGVLLAATDISAKLLR